MIKSQNSGRTTVGFDHSLPIGVKTNGKVALDSPSIARKGNTLVGPEEEEKEEDVLRPDPTTGILYILKGCLKGSQSIARAASSEAYSGIFGLKIEKRQGEGNLAGDVFALEEDSADMSKNFSISFSSVRRAKSPRRQLAVRNEDSSSLSPSPARNRLKSLAYRTEEEEGEDLDTLHLLENLLPPMPSTLVFEAGAASLSAKPLSPRKSGTVVPSSSYFFLQTPSASWKRLEMQLESSGMAELRSHHEVARREIYDLLKDKRKRLTDLEQRIRQDAKQLLGQRSRSNSKEEAQRMTRVDLQVEQFDEQGLRRDESPGGASSLFERRRPLPALSSEMARSSSQTTQMDTTAFTNPSFNSGSGSVMMPGRASSSTATNGAASKVGSYLSASFAMRGRDLPQVPASTLEENNTLESQEDEEEWYAQKRRLRERYPHADHSELPSAVNSDDESNVQTKKKNDSDEDEDEQSRGRGRGRQSARTSYDNEEVKKSPKLTNVKKESAPPFRKTLSDETSLSEESPGIKKGALKGSLTKTTDSPFKDKVPVSNEKKVAFAEMPRFAASLPPSKEEESKEVVDEGAAAVFEIDEEMDEENPSDLSIDFRAIALEREKDVLQSADTEEELSKTGEADVETVQAEELISSHSRGGIAQSLPIVGSFAAMANSELNRQKGETITSMDQQESDFDPASIRLDDEIAFSSRQSETYLSTSISTELNRINLNDTSVYGSRPRGYRSTPSGLGPDPLLSGFPQSSMERSSTIGFRVAVGEAEAKLNGLLAPHIPSHRNLWASPSKEKARLNNYNSSKYILTENVSEETADDGNGEKGKEMAWKQRLQEAETKAKSVAAEDIARSVPIGISISPSNWRNKSTTSTTTTFHDETSGFDLEPKTSLPYREKQFTPSLRKATRHLSSLVVPRNPTSDLATISDASEADGSTASASVLSSPNNSQRPATEMAKREPVAKTKENKGPSVPASITRGFLQSVNMPAQTDPLPTSTQSTPGLGSKGAHFEQFGEVRGSRRSVIRDPYVPPPPPSTYTLRLEPNEGSRPRAIPLSFDKDEVETILNADKEEKEEMEKVLKFMHTIEQLKTNKRTGWYHHRINHPESIADHMYRMAILSMLLPNEKLDIGKCVQLCLVHDIAEALVGDLTPLDGISKEEKLKREKEALLYLVHDLLGSSRAAQRLEQLWMEYEDRDTLESKVVKDLDRFELCLQAVEYERRFTITDLQPFFEGSVGEVKHVSFGISLVEELT